MPRKMTGRAIIRLVVLRVASSTPIVVFERTTHLYRGPTTVSSRLLAEA